MVSALPSNRTEHGAILCKSLKYIYVPFMWSEASVSIIHGKKKFLLVNLSIAPFVCDFNMLNNVALFVTQPTNSCSIRINHKISPAINSWHLNSVGLRSPFTFLSSTNTLLDTTSTCIAMATSCCAWHVAPQFWITNLLKLVINIMSLLAIWANHGLAFSIPSWVSNTNMYYRTHGVARVMVHTRSCYIT